ncbi:MAG: hypothetical protein LBR79_02405 [Oscillospiraceae bacterium]|nr:hypothetical protein [Oscillospiraceae bacterium]
MYFLPAVGREKVIKIRYFSNETAIVWGLTATPVYLAQSRFSANRLQPQLA